MTRLFSSLGYEYQREARWITIGKEYVIQSFFQFLWQLGYPSECQFVGTDADAVPADPSVTKIDESHIAQQTNPPVDDPRWIAYCSINDRGMPSKVMAQNE